MRSHYFKKGSKRSLCNIAIREGSTFDPQDFNNEFNRCRTCERLLHNPPKLKGVQRCTNVGEYVIGVICEQHHTSILHCAKCGGAIHSVHIHGVKNYYAHNPGQGCA
jgi:hypothetical protein